VRQIMRLSQSRSFLAASKMALAASAAFLLVLTGCDDEPEQPIEVSAGGVAPPAKKAPAGRGKAGGSVPGAAVPSNLPALPVREFKERDFIETDLSRDPFRGFEEIFLNESKGRIRLQRAVVVDNYALDELRLVGIVSRGTPRALLKDPSGLGHIAKVGDFVGTAEVVHSSGASAADVALNWRIDRIRSNDVVFIREDPSHPEIPTSTRIMSLRTPDELIIEVKSGTRAERPERGKKKYKGEGT